MGLAPTGSGLMRGLARSSSASRHLFRSRGPEQLHGRISAPTQRHRQGRIARLGPEIDVGPGLDEFRDELRSPPLVDRVRNGIHQGRHPLDVPHIGIGPGFQQQSDDAAIPRPGLPKYGPDQPRAAPLAGHVKGRAGLE